MSKNLSDQARSEYEDEVKHQYDKANTNLLMTVRHKKVSAAADAYFPTYGKGKAKDPKTDRSAEGLIVGMGVESGRVDITLVDREAPEFTDIFEQAKTNIDDRRELAIVIANTVSRTEEQFVIDAWKNATYAANLDPRDVANAKKAMKIPHADKGMTKEKINKARALMVNRNVSGEFHACASAEDLEQMLNDSTITSSDYNTVRALVDGDIKTWAGFKWNFIGVRPEGGLPFDSTAGDGTAISSAFFYEKQSTGVITNLKNTYVSWEGLVGKWLSNTQFQTGSKVIDAEGLIQIQSKVTIGA